MTFLNQDKTLFNPQYPTHTSLLLPSPKMEKENKLKLKISRIFNSSCKTQDLSQVIDHQNPIFAPQTPLMNQNDSFSFPVIRPKQMSILKPRCPESFENCIIPTAGKSIPRRKITGMYSLLSPASEFSGRRCPPVSPASPLNQIESKQGKKKKKNKKQISKNDSKNEKTHLRNYPFSFSSSNENDVGDWFSSDDEREETETLFSSLKSTSFSSESELHNPTRTRTRTQSRNPRRRAYSGQACWVVEPDRFMDRTQKPNIVDPTSGPNFKRAGSREVGVMPLQGKVKDTFAVVKNSSDPYNDFRKSMVEMIIEKEIFGVNELEELVECFLSLNSPQHHRVIVEVFTEIWDALFSSYCS